MVIVLYVIIGQVMGTTVFVSGTPISIGLLAALAGAEISISCSLMDFCAAIDQHLKIHCVVPCACAKSRNSFVRFMLFSCIAQRSLKKISIVYNK